MNKFNRYITVLFISFLFISWGSKGHYIINKKCTDSFPASMTAFKVWADSLILHGSDADNRKTDKTEGPKHYIDIDNYAEFTSTGRIASTYDSIVNLHGSTFVISNGTLPWATRNTYDSLKLAFKQFNWHKAMLLASDLGHYVGDGHMPLHLSANYDGQATYYPGTSVSQKGIHSRYESDMVYTYYYSLGNFTGSSVSYVGGNVNKYIFDYIYRNQRYVDSVLIADRYAYTKDATYGTTYTTALWNKTQFTITLLQNASHALAELIYSAWVDAGSPAFGASTGLNSVAVPSVVVYPNPTKGIVNLTGNTQLQTQVYSFNGQLLDAFVGNKFNIAHLPNGIYILNISSTNGFSKKEKITLSN